MPRVSEKIHKFLKELALTSDEKAALREDIGAAAGSDVVSDTAYNESTWNGVTGVAPSKNAVRDKFEALAAAIGDPEALTFDGDDPNATDQLSIAGVSTTGVNGFVIPAGTLNGKQFWSNDGTQVLGAGNTVVYYDAQWIVARGSSYRAVAMQNVASPVGLNYTLHVGSGTATVANVPYVASFLGQWCKATTAWWQWDGTAWIPRQTLSGQQITRSDADDAYFILGVDGDGAPTTSPFP